MKIFEAIEKLIPKAPPCYYIVQADNKIYVIYSKDFNKEIVKLPENWKIIDIAFTYEEAKKYLKEQENSYER